MDTVDVPPVDTLRADQRPEVDLSRNTGTCLLANEKIELAGKIALTCFRKPGVKLVRDDQAKDPVTEKLQALVGLGPACREAGVRQGARQMARILESIAGARTELFDKLLVGKACHAFVS